MSYCKACKTDKGCEHDILTGTDLVKLRTERDTLEKQVAVLLSAMKRMEPHISKGEPYGAEKFAEHRLAMREMELALINPNLGANWVPRSKLKEVAEAVREHCAVHLEWAMPMANHKDTMVGATIIVRSTELVTILGEDA